MEVKPTPELFSTFLFIANGFYETNFVSFGFGLGLPQGTEKQDSEQFFRKVLGPSDGSALSGTIQTTMRPVLEGESNRSGLALRNLPGKIKPNAHLLVCTCY